MRDAMGGENRKVKIYSINGEEMLRISALF